MHSSLRSLRVACLWKSESAIQRSFCIIIMEKFQMLLAALQRHPVISEVAGRHLLFFFPPFRPCLLSRKQNQSNHRASIMMHLVLFYYQPGIACIGEVGLRNWMQVSKLAFVVVVCAPVTSQYQTALTAAQLFSCSLHHALKNVSVKTTGGKGVKNRSYSMIWLEL